MLERVLQIEDDVADDWEAEVAGEGIVDNWEDEAAMIFDKKVVIDKRVEISFLFVY